MGEDPPPQNAPQMPMIVNVVAEATECPRLPILGPVHIYDRNANATSARISAYS
jgi:hypothetical protein